jgi:uncharacterized protein YecT (DUF1311 family)
MDKKISKPFWKKWWFFVIAFIVVIYFVGGKGGGGSTSQSAAKEDLVTTRRPSDESNFIRIVAAAQQQERDAKNDMQKGGVKSERDKSLCDSMKGVSVQGWTGRISRIDANSDGKGVLDVEIANDVHLKTWNNAVSDLADNTLLDPSSQVFISASKMEKGTPVMISGRFFVGNSGDCLKEGSLTLAGKLRDPGFIFSFDSIGVLSAAQVPAVASVPTPTPTPTSTTTQAAPAAVALEAPASDSRAADPSAASMKEGQGQVDIKSQANTPSEMRQGQEQQQSTPVQAVDANVTPTSFSPDNAKKPSFDCSKASSQVEKLICGTPVLAAADADLATAYKDAMAKADDKGTMKSSQLDWIKNVRNKCADEACLNQAYAQRTSMLLGAN